VSPRSLRALAALFRQCGAEAEARGAMRLAEHYYGIAAGWERMAVKAEKTSADDGRDSPAS
jgi:hypothetical protein